MTTNKYKDLADEIYKREHKVDVSLLTKGLKKHGGSRPGAGHPVTITDESQRRTGNTIRLPAWMWEKLKAQPGGAGRAVEQAVMLAIEQHKIFGNPI